jgi:hypothetical protein
VNEDLLVLGFQSVVQRLTVEQQELRRQTEQIVVQGVENEDRLAALDLRPGVGELDLLRDVVVLGTLVDLRRRDAAGRGQGDRKDAASRR